MTAPTTLTTAVAPAEGGFAVTIGGRPLRTPGGRALVVPSAALAREIAAEVAARPEVLSGKGLNDPAAAPHYRIAAGAVDVLAADAAARAGTERELAAYGETDLVCFRSGAPATLAAREAAAWDPLCAWFADRFGARLAVTRTLAAPGQEAGVGRAIGGVLAEADPFRLAALALATKAAGSIVIALALAEGRLDAEAAFAAAFVEEAFQEETWGTDAETARVRAGKRLDLVHAARFLGLLAEA